MLPRSKKHRSYNRKIQWEKETLLLQPEILGDKEALSLKKKHYSFNQDQEIFPVENKKEYRSVPLTLLSFAQLAKRKV
jgi:hypothetical protein